jgi:hypothetical protein
VCKALGERRWREGSEDEHGGVGRGCGTPFIGPEGAGGGGSMGGQPATINGARFGSKEKWRGGEMGSRGGGGVAVPFHYAGGRMATGRRT